MINPFIYAEEACGFDRIEDLEEARPSQYFTRELTRFSVEAAEWQVGCFTHDAPAIPADLGRSRSC